MRLSCNISYDGTAYAGWQIQPNSRTVQEVIEKSISTITRNPVSITGCGRTDAGVHASDFYFHCDIEQDSMDLSKLAYRLNSILPDDISVHKISQVGINWNARYSALTRRYKYFFHTNRNPFIRKYSYYYPELKELSLSDIDRFCSFVRNQSDFKPFCKSNSQVNHHLCQIYHVKFSELGDHRYVLDIKANRFLRGMIRLIVGAMLNVARGKLHQQELDQAFINQQSLPINWSVPSHGLFLSELTYPAIE